MMTRAYAIGSTLVNASLQYLGIALRRSLYGVLLFDEHLTWMALAGMLLIVARRPGGHAAAQPHARAPPRPHPPKADMPDLPRPTAP